ncbi:hypothetical protein R6Q57_021720 [Mikania cordata]
MKIIIWLQLAVIIAIFPTAELIATSTNNTIDQDALLAIKSLIKNDPKGVTSLWNNSLHFCQWQGVTCSTRHRRVSVLDLSSSGLVGSLSPWIGNMSFLRYIMLQNNSFNGEIPTQLGRLFRLQVLRLTNNSFDMNIPSSLSNCSNLQVLHLGGNKLVGRIPYEFGSLKMLKLFVIHRNILTGGIPSFIGNFTLLETFSLGGCHLGGIIPDFFHRLKNLKRLILPENELVGTIPASVYNLSMLESLFLDDNQLHGTLDTNLFLLQPRLQEISLPDNQFTGSLDASIFNSTELRTLDVSRNNLSGKLVIRSPNVCQFVEMSLGFNNFGSMEGDDMGFIDTLSNCSLLEKLDVGGNSLRGNIPKSLEYRSRKLYFLSFASNSISGNLPSSIGNLSGLTTLSLSYNQFMGTIPESIGRLQNLVILELKGNSFTGNIPGTIGNLSSLIQLHMGMNTINGTIPSNLGDCKKLLGLTVEQNQLSGSIPRNIFELSSLSVILDLGGNRLSGHLPDFGNGLKNLNELVLADNQLSGELPSSIGSCTSLQTLDIGGNFFNGSLPSSMGSLRALQNLDVSSNNFTGQIPGFLETISLDNLNLSFNSFEGLVSSKGVFANFSAISIIGNSRLCGGIPELNLPKCSSKGRKKLSLAVILVITLVVVLFCAAMVSFVFFYCLKRKNKHAHDTSNSISAMHMTKASYKKLYNATQGFFVNNMIGKGSFASVYRGDLGLDGGIVAVKVINLQHRGGSKSFISECKALCNARHRNLVKVITCCSSFDFEGNEFKALIYEFMPNGSLDKWLHWNDRKENMQKELLPLSLLQRVCIALDVAYAIDYLHNDRTIVHCDLKPSNILLDEDMVAHVGDFGLSKILQSEPLHTYDSSSTGVRGTIGYAPPEYGIGGKVSRSGDIYSYGILLLEMVTCKRPTDSMFKEGLNLHKYASKAMGDHFLEICDPIILRNDCSDPAQLTKNEGEETVSMRKEAFLRLMLELGVACSMELPQHRTDIRSVIKELHLIKDVMLDTSTF